MNEILLIYSLPYPKDINRKIIMKHKYNLLEKKYNMIYKELNKHFLYYSWLRKQLIRKKLINKEYSLLKIIKEYDIY